MDDVLNRAPAGFLSVDDEGVIRETNLTLEQMLEYEPGELSGRRIDDILAVGGRIYYQTHFFPALKLQDRLEEIYLKLRTKSGRVVPVLTRAVRHLRQNGEIQNDCVLLRMTQREQYEDEILRAKRAAEEANDAKAKFVSMMSHELRTPLQSILGYAELLATGADGALNKTQLEDIESIKLASRGLARLLDDILNFARVGAGDTTLELKRISVSEAVHRADTLVKLRIQEAGLEYERGAIPEKLAVRADDSRLQQILLNLLVNALKFTNRGGRITTRGRENDGFVSIDVSDTGLGIKKEDLAKIFEPFVQLDQARQTTSSRGVGLGLAISRDLARAMGGDLTVASELGHGSTFTIRLPAYPEP